MATVTISLPDQIAKKVDAEAKTQGFSTRSEFVRSLLRKYFAGEEFKFEVFEPQTIEDIKLELAKLQSDILKNMGNVETALQERSEGKVTANDLKSIRDMLKNDKDINFNFEEE